MERIIPLPNSRYDPEYPIDNDDEEISRGGTNHPPQANVREPIPPPTYTEANLHPTIPDPRCEPEWPLACYWPVFVANFRLDDLAEGARNAQIASYFAAKGLLARMICILDPDKCLFKTLYQHQTMLLDMLVYFTREEDAARAIRICHRESYYGHRLNVFPGREPVFFDPARSVGFELTKNYCAEKSDTVVERIFCKHHGPCVATVTRFNEYCIAVEFTSTERMRAAIRYSKFWKPVVLNEATRKQRFLEQDVKKELLTMIADIPGFLDTVPPKEVLQELLAGRIPVVDRSWENMDRPRGIPEATKARYKLKKEKRIENLKQNHQRKRQSGKGEGENVLLDGAPPAKKEVTYKQRRVQIRQEADRILGEGQSAAAKFNFSMLAKKNKYLKLKQTMLEATKKMNLNKTSNEMMELFYGMLAMEEELMDYLPQCYEHFGLLGLEKGLSHAVLFAGYSLPYPECPPPESVEQFHEDLPPPNGPIADPPATTPTVRPYSATDLQPAVRDPRCEPNWPLANLWPVYVDNFRLNTLNVTLRNEQIHNYFAAKGLLATRIFIHDNPRQAFFVWYQKKVMVFDMLVYFTSPEDAEKAIQLCHRECYYGHYLNVFPGRKPVFYDVERSGFTKLRYFPKIKIAEHPQLFPTTYIEENILEALPQDISCVTRCQKDGPVNFEYIQRDRLVATLPRLAKDYNYKSGFLTEPIRKQRFLESEMLNQIMEQLLEDPLFMTAQPKPELLEALFGGSVPSALINWNWCGWPDPRKSHANIRLGTRLAKIKKGIMEILLVWRHMNGIEGQEKKVVHFA